MITLALAMIVKNEESVLARCLDSVKDIVDELIIVDTGSTDKTVEIAKKYTDNVYHFKWINDFSAARNYAFDQATTDYIMWLDADDIVPADELEKMRALKSEIDQKTDIVMMRYNVGFDDDGNVTMSNFRERWMKRATNLRWSEPVHECITPAGVIQQVEIAINHGEKVRTHTTRNLDIYEAQTELTARGTFYFARELATHNRFEEAIDNYERFLSSGNGWKEDNIRACIDLASCYEAIGRKAEQLNVLFKSFTYDPPRSEVCCKIGTYFFTEANYPQALYWYDLATTPNAQKEAGFFTKDYCDFIPYIQMCIIFDRIGNHEQALEYHKKSQLLKPDHPSVIFNEDYFSRLFANKSNT